MEWREYLLVCTAIACIVYLAVMFVPGIADALESLLYRLFGAMILPTT